MEEGYIHFVKIFATPRGKLLLILQIIDIKFEIDLGMSVQPSASIPLLAKTKIYYFQSWSKR